MLESSVKINFIVPRYRCLAESTLHVVIDTCSVERRPIKRYLWLQMTQMAELSITKLIPSESKDYAEFDVEVVVRAM